MFCGSAKTCYGARRACAGCAPTDSLCVAYYLHTQQTELIVALHAVYAGDDLLQLLTRETELRRRAEQMAEEARHEKASAEQLRTMQARQIASLNGTVADLHKQLQQYQHDSGDLVSAFAA